MKKRVIDGVKTLLDVAKESADWFPPLKSALGGVTALIKHYEQFEDVKEKIEELVPQLDRLKQHIATTTVTGDLEETNRRSCLTSKFKQIEELSKKLLEKNAIARFADRGEDSKVVTRLIDRLGEAIACYQVSQQQAIYHHIVHLTSSFDTLLKLQEKPPVMRAKLESIVGQLDRLKDAPWKELRREQWAKLFDNLRPLKDKVNAVYERVTAEGYEESEGDAVTVSGLAEDLRDVLLEYWTAQQQAVYDQNCTLIDAADLLVLNSSRRAQGAEHRHGDRRGCLKGTRGTVLSEIESWAKDFDKSPVFWLNGLAGTGKSTIAQTISERVFAEDGLGASFFCSRDFKDRSNLQFIIPTLAFQLAHKYSDFRSYLVPLLRRNPDVAHESLYGQMKKLIAEPLRKTGISTVIVIDALDECKDDEPSSVILSVLGRFVGQIPRVKFFITGRPEPRIKTGFRLPLLVDSTDVFVLHDVHSSLINNDIRLFLKHELSQLARRRQLERWPSDEHIDLLCQRAGGLFVYAVATVKFLGSHIHLPKNQLAAILKLPESTVPEGKTRFNQNTTLDSLYTSILQAAISEGDPDVDSRVRTTLGAIIFVVNPLPPSAIAELMDLDPEEVILFVTLISSLLAVGEDFDHPVKPFHKSFPDFITDPSRCVNPRFCISPGQIHVEIVMNCLKMLNDRLEPNLLSLPEYALNLEVEDLQARIDNQVGIALRYACQSWHNHLTETRGDISKVISSLSIFLEQNFLAWLEVLSVLGDIRGGTVGLEKLMTWLQEDSKDDQLLSTARDCFYFATKFFEPISVSATHIYHSALELCPMSSIVRRLYYRQGRPIVPWPRVMIGTPDSWDHVVSISNEDHEYGFCIWSPCGQFVAAQTAGVVEVRDQLTFELLTILRPTETSHTLTGPVAYSPDGRSIACASDTSVVIWDIQTGGVAREIWCDPKSISVVWSLDGRKIGFIDSNKTVHIYDLASGTKISPGKFSSTSDPYFWAHERSFRILTTVPFSDYVTTVDVLEVGTVLAKVYSFNFTWGIKPKSNLIISYSPTTCRFAISLHRALHMFENWNRIHSPLGGEVVSSHCFSPDGRTFAVVTEEKIYIWVYTSHCYTPWKELRCPGKTNSFLQSSPSQSSIVGSFGHILQGWRLPHHPTTPATSRQQYVGLSRSGNYIAAAYRSESTITVINIDRQAPPQFINIDRQASPQFININRQAPPQFIDTGRRIEGLALTGNVLLALTSGSVVALLLTEGGLVVTEAGRPKTILSTGLYRSHHGPTFSVQGPVGVLAPCGGPSSYIIYHTETGRKLQAPQQLSNGPWQYLGGFPTGRDRNIHDLSQHNAPPEGDQQTPRIILSGEWASDPEGRRRLWIPVEWRADWDLADWCHDIATQFSILGGKTVVIKFWH